MDWRSGFGKGLWWSSLVFGIVNIVVVVGGLLLHDEVYWINAIIAVLLIGAIIVKYKEFFSD